MMTDLSYVDDTYVDSTRQSFRYVFSVQFSSMFELPSHTRGHHVHEDIWTSFVSKHIAIFINCAPN